MAITLKDAVLVHLDPPSAGPGELRIENGIITQVEADIPAAPDDEVIDCRGCVVMPGLVNGHTHLYSALAVGLPPPPRAPANFHEILQLIWWRLDRALDPTSIRFSGQIGALDAVCCGTTTLIDHHASPESITDSLDALEQGIDAVGLRAILCYETTDRNDRAGAEAGLEENRRFASKCRSRKDHRFGAMVGAHAAFTMSDKTLRACAAIANETGGGVHIHVAEDPCDDHFCREQYGAPLVKRLEGLGILQPETILAHCTHLSPEDGRRLSTRVGAVAHNPRSNMHNQVGYARIGSLARVQLGTDGIGADMFTEARHAWFKARDAGVAIGPGDILAMLAQSARTASRRLGCTLGKLEVGAAADIMLTDYQPSTPIHRTNVAGHFIFGLGAQHVRDVMIDGRWLLRNRMVQTCDESEIRRAAAAVAGDLWRRMQAL